jgi:hypothetical protein
MTIASQLSPLQTRLLVLLAGLDPPWTLTGGAALAGFYLGHRRTRDLDLFWRGVTTVEPSARQVRERLSAHALDVSALQTSPTFVQLRITDAHETVVLDLVADRVAPVEPPARLALGSVSIDVDSRHEILVNKLCALLGRLELRDLVDLRALLAAGGELPRALQDAPRKDRGFSPPTLAWVLRDFPVEPLAARLGADAPEQHALAAFRDVLIEQLLQLSRPDGS